MFRTSTQLLSYQVYLFIYDFKRDKYHSKHQTIYPLIFVKYKRVTYKMVYVAMKSFHIYYLLTEFAFRTVRY